MRQLLPHRRAPFTSRGTLVPRALVPRPFVPKRLGLIFSHRLSHLIPLYVMWLVCLNLVSAALIAQDYQRSQALVTAEPPVSTVTSASGSGA